MQRFYPANVAVDHTSNTIGAFSQFFRVFDWGEISCTILLGS
jgi:hypothetical protein